MDESPVTLPDVEIVDIERSGVLRCRVGTREFVVPRYYLLPGSGNPRTGTKGAQLVLPRWFAENLGVGMPIPDAPAPNSAPVAVSHLADPSRAQRILVVEDHAESREVLRALLEWWGHHVVCTESGHQALEFAVEMKLDAIVLAFCLPDMDAREFVRTLRSVTPKPTPLIVAYSGMPSASVEARDVSVDVLIPKPDASALEGLFGSPGRAGARPTIAPAEKQKKP